MTGRSRGIRNSHHYERGGVTVIRTGKGKKIQYKVHFPADPWGLGWCHGKKNIYKRFDRLTLAMAWYKKQIDLQDRCHADGTEYLTEREQIEKRREQAMPFNKYVAEYLAGYHTEDGMGRRPTVATMQNKRNAARHLTDFFKDTPLTEIRKSDVVECSQWLARFGVYQRNRSMKELKTILRRAALKDDDGHSLIPYDPSQGVPTPRVPGHSKQSRIRTISPAEEQGLYQWFLANKPQVAILIPLACNVVLRPEEYLALKVKDVHPGRGTIDVVRAQHWIKGVGTVPGSLKTESTAGPRPIPVPLMRMIERHIRTYTDGKPESWLIPTTSGNMLMRGVFYNWFKQAAASIGRPELTAYKMRGTADDRISRSHPANIKEYITMTGRSDVATAVNHYEDTDPASMRHTADQAWNASHPAGMDAGLDHVSILETGIDAGKHEDKGKPDALASANRAEQLASLKREAARMRREQEEINSKIRELENL